MRSLYVLLAVSSVLSAALGQSYLGRVDTIGGTTYDWQSTLGVVRMLVNSPDYGLHAAWLWSGDTAGASGLNMRYNFYDYDTRRWNWIDPDFMQSGGSVFMERTGFGNIDADPHTGAAAFCGYAGTSALWPIVARDVGPGAGIFEFCNGPEGYLWPRVAIDSQGTFHIAMSEQAAYIGVRYSRIRTWGVWDSVTQPGDTAAPAYSVVASRHDDKVCVEWARHDSSSLSWRVFYVLSTDAGETWNTAVEVPTPTAFGGDTATIFSWAGPFPFFDDESRLHLMAAVEPVVHETAYVMPAEIWHWCADNEPDWAEVHRAACDPQQLQAPLGHNVIYADRPSIGQGAGGRLYVSWEQFDSSNVEPQTNLLRAGIWAASSADNGASWTPGVLLTERNTVSHRYPCVVDRTMNGGPAGDTVTVLFLADQVAGSALYNQGPFTRNPVICQFVPAPLIGVSERDATASRPAARGLLPTIMRRLPAGAVAFDAMGRMVVNPKPGVYFVRTEPSAASRQPSAVIVRKVVIQK